MNAERRYRPDLPVPLGQLVITGTRYGDAGVRHRDCDQLADIFTATRRVLLPGLRLERH